MAFTPVDRVLVVKSERMLYLKSNGEILRRYPVALGPVPWGHKQQEGDERTPEGQYVLDFKNEQSRFYKSIRVSYPNLTDRLRAQELGVNPGGDIMIHGQPEGAEASAVRGYGGGVLEAPVPCFPQAEEGRTRQGRRADARDQGAVLLGQRAAVDVQRRAPGLDLHPDAVPFRQRRQSLGSE